MYSLDYRILFFSTLFRA